MENTRIIIRGAREHNLQDVNLDLPRNRLIVFTGVSGSGKSSLAFDTLYAEGQRRYVESLSSYARQFLGQLQKPDVDYLAGLSPAISIQQKTAGRNPRSTVGTITEVYDYLRVLYARVGQGHCPKCGRPITAQTREQIIGRVQALPEGTRFLVLAPVIRGQKGEYKDLFEEMLRRGFVRARVDGQVVRLTDDLRLDRRIKHDIAIVIDRLKNEPKARPRLAEAVEQALALGQGTLIVAVEREAQKEQEIKENRLTPSPLRGEGLGEGATASNRTPSPLRGEGWGEGEDILLSAHYACTHCDRSYEPPSPQLFSFNSPHGMCMECDGLGFRFSFDPDLLIPEPSLSFFEGALPLVGPMRGMGRWRKHIFEGMAQSLGVNLKTPWRDLPKQHRNWILHGAGDRHITYEWKLRGGGAWKHGGKWEGLIPQFLSSFKKTAAGPRRLQLEKYMRVMRCPACQGERLNSQARAVRLGGKTLVEVCAMPIGDLAEWFDADKGPLEKNLEPIRRAIAAEVLKEIRGRLAFLLNVGLHYLTLGRSAPTLSGGEAQRIRLAGQIGCGLVGVLYILDEPSIGLHPRDNDQLLRSLERLRDMGNTVVVVEHDEETMRSADHIVDFGPGPGIRGGQVVAAGSFAEVVRNPKSLTGQYLAGLKAIAIPPERRPPAKKRLKIFGARQNNLKNINVEFPLGLFTCVTGVSGSGKSSLVNDVLRQGLSERYGLGAKEDQEEATAQDGQRAENKKSKKQKTAPGNAVDRASDTSAPTEVNFDRIAGTDQIDKVIDIDQSPIGRTPRSNPATYIKVFDEVRSLFAQVPEAKIRGYSPGRFSFNKPGGRCEACEGNGSNRLEMDFLADVWVTCPVCEGRRFNRETLQIRFKGKNIQDVLEMDVQEALEHFANIPKIRAMLQTLHDVGLDYIKLGQPSPTLSGGEAQRIKLARELCRRSTGQTLYILDEPTTGLHFDDIDKLLRVLHGFVEAGNTVVVIEHNLDVIKTADWVIDLGPEGGAGGGEVVCAGAPEDVAACERSYTGLALRQGPFRKPGKPTSGSKRKAARTRENVLSQEPITHLTVQGAQQHNLKNINVTLPRENMTVFCGPSGSGKSSLALDTIYAEGQRRYIESLSAYARQFLGQMQKPKVEHVAGLSPAISIEQKTTSKSPRSTVGTVTEVYDYLRILYARLGQPYCPACDIPIGTQTTDEIIDKIAGLPEGTKFYLMAPLVRRGQEKYEALWDEIRRSGFIRMRVDGRSYNVDEPPSIDHRRKHQVEVIVDRLVARTSQRGRIADAVEAALELGRGVLHVAHVDAEREEPEWKVERFSLHFACDRCGRSFEPLNPHHFSFNSPLGWCPTCEGLGVQKGASTALIIRDPRRSLREGALAAWPNLTPGSAFGRFAEALSRHLKLSLDAPFERLTPGQKQAILHGTGENWLPLEIPEARQRSNKNAPPTGIRFQYKGVFPAIDEASRVSFVYRHKLDHLVSEVACSACGGSRLRDDAASCRFAGHRIGGICDLPLGQTLKLFKELDLGKAQRQIAGEVLREITNRLQFLADVGLDYLTLSRPTPTLSGGESQRIRLASQIGSGLTGVLYVLDEPTIGLHPRDNRRLLQALTHLRNLGNTLILVEHDREVIASADYLLDFGPGAGDQGGEITAQGSPKQVTRSKTSLTGQYLSNKKAISIPSNRRIKDLTTSPLTTHHSRLTTKHSPLTTHHSPLTTHHWLTVKGARHNNLKNIDVRFPLGSLITVTGVSGSGKSSLVHEILYNTLARKLHRAKTSGAAHDAIEGLEQIDKIINVDQDPIGNSPSSNPATYTGVFDLIRQLFAQLPEAKVRGYHPRRFSFNKPGGRCEACEGNGQKKIEMHFLPDVWVECDVCHGSRYNPETLAVRYKGRSVADVLQMRVHEALELFANIPKIRRILQTLADVGLDYLSLGQPAPTLSGGEAQRVKLAAELGRPNTGRTLYLLDEPTTGLHFDDIAKLLEVLNRLVDLGNTVIVVEHNLDVIKTADWVIDLGPEAGDAGGQIVAEGSPEGIVGDWKNRIGATNSSSPTSHTAAILAEVLDFGPYAERPKHDRFSESTPREGDLELEHVGREAKMPWETDGRHWHTQDRVTNKGAPCRWEGEILNWVDRQVRAAGTFSETNWNHRSVIEIAASNKSHGWFLHAMTSMEWCVRLVFRVSRNTFKQERLVQRLGIRPLNETPGIEAYGDQDRVQVDNLRGPWQAVSVLVHRLSEIDTPEFREFLAEAVKSFQANIKRLMTRPEDVMPWKLNGERWHLGEKGFPIGRRVDWDRSLLPRLLDLVREVEPGLEVNWNSRAAISLRVPGIGRLWSQWRTKESYGLDCRFIGKKGQFNLSQLEGLGRSPTIHTSRADADVVQLAFRSSDDFKRTELKKFLAESLRGFKEVRTQSRS
jgi:excinuclease ABC subunit A